MVRSTRSRKPHPKYSSDQYELSPSPKKSLVKKIVTATQAAAAASKGSRGVVTKGNLNSGLRSLTGSRTVVLRDRTNLHEEALKVDVLIKQGGGPGVASKSTKVVRGGGSKAAEGKDDEEGTEKTSSVGGTRKKRKLENDGEDAALENLKNRKKNRTDVEKIVEPARASRRGTRAMEKLVAASKSEKKATAGRKKVLKEENEDPGKKVVSPGITRSSSLRNAALASKTTRKIVKSSETVEKSSKPEVTRKATRQVVRARETSVDSGLGTREVAGNDENAESDEKLGERASRRESRAKPDKASAKSSVEEKKFFKTKASERKLEKRSPVKKTVTAKRRNIGTARLSVSFRSRQATLQESFAKQISRKVLRPRKSQQNYCEETMLEKKAASSKTGNDEPKKTGPVYKSLKPEDDSCGDKNAVYDFKFDSNDSREKLPTKKRKRNVRKKIVTKKATKTTSEKAKIKKTDQPVSRESEKPQERMEIDNFPEEIDEPPVEMEKIVDPPKKLENLTKVSEKSSKPEATAKPRVLESIELKGNDCLTLTTTPILAKSSDPKARNHLRPPKQFRTMLSHALLNKSISPITKAIENFDPGSPWRPPVFQDFSRVKNIVQSTPQVRNFTTKLQSAAEKIAPPETKKIDVPETKIEPKIAKIVTKVPREFGNEISRPNDQEIVASRLPDSAKQISREIEKKDEKIETPGVQDPKSTSTSILSRLSVPSNDNFGNELGDTINFSPGDKENSLPVVSSAKRSPLKSLNRTPFGNLNNSPMKNLNRSPLKNLQNSSSENAQKSPFKNLQNSPLKNLQNSSSENVRKSPFKNLQNSSSENVQKSPFKNLQNVQNLPLKNLQNSSSENVQKSPFKNLQNVQKSSSKNLQNSPLKILQNSSSENLQKSPLKNLQNVQKSPLKNLQNLSSENVQNSPLKNQQNSSSENVQKSALKTLQRSASKNLEKSPLKDPKKILAMLRAKKMQNPVIQVAEDDSRVLRQSNLDNFLNLDEMPKSTRINTLHGIFDDAHSTPIAGKPAKKTCKDSNLENAFGFDVSDEDSESEISPIKKLSSAVPPEKKVLTKIDEKAKIAVPARFSVGEIKKHLLPMRPKATVDQEATAVIERIEEEAEAKEKSPEKKKKPKTTKIPDPVDFSDTFDLHEKSANIEDDTTMKFELFADIEPQHFKQAPRYSYKRKRAVGFHFSESDDENPENLSEQTENAAPKRRKINKAEKERNKKLENWAKDLNQTFEEIEHFDLVVE